MGKGGGGGGRVETTTTRSEPWAGQAPYLQQGFQAASNQILNRPTSYYPGQTVSPFSGESQYGLVNLFERGKRPQDFAPYEGAARNQIQQTAGGTYLDQLRNFQGPGQYELGQISHGDLGYGAGYGMYQPIAQGGLGYGPGYSTYSGAAQGLLGNAATGMAGGLAQAGPTDIATPLLLRAAQGEYLNANPYLDKMYGRAAEGVQRAYQQSMVPGIDSAFALAGRRGSGAHAYGRTEADRQLGESLGGLATDIYGRNYETERALQQQAQGMLGQLQGQNFAQRLAATGMFGELSAADRARQLQGAAGMQEAFGADAARRLAAISGMQGAFESDAARRLTAAQSIAGLGEAERGRQMQAAAMAPAMQAMDYQNINAMLQAGQARDALEAERIQDAMNRWNFAQQEPTQRIGNAMSIIAGGQFGGTQQQQVPIYQNRLAGGLGGLMTGGLLGSMIGAPYTLPFMALGGLSGLAGR